MARKCLLMQPGFSYDFTCTGYCHFLSRPARQARNQLWFTTSPSNRSRCVHRVWKAKKAIGVLAMKPTVISPRVLSKDLLDHRDNPGGQERRWGLMTSFWFPELPGRIRYVQPSFYFVVPCFTLFIPREIFYMNYFARRTEIGQSFVYKRSRWLLLSLAILAPRLVLKVDFLVNLTLCSCIDDSSFSKSSWIC